MNDTFRHKGLRKNLVEELRKKGISDEKVLDAITAVPRHLFMDSGFVQFAYKDQAFPISCKQTISQPFTVAFQSSLLEVKRHEKILEIGTGSGYQSAILAEIGAKVFTIERHRDLFVKAQDTLTLMGYNIRFFYGDGYQGLEAFAPFDKILVTAGATEVPEKLKLQLKPGGILVIPVGDGDVQIMKKIVRKSDNEFDETEHGRFVFVPMIKGKSVNGYE